jgi:cell wall assembly regulator SMI1
MTALSEWLAAHAPALRGALAEPATDEAIAACEALVSRKLPAEYVAFLREHDGQRFADESLAPIFQAFEFLGTKFARGEWESMREWDEADEAWWPITTIYGSSHHHCIDEDGSIIVVAMDDPGSREVIASSFAELMERLVSLLDDSIAETTEEGIELSDDAMDWLLGG